MPAFPFHPSKSPLFIFALCECPVLTNYVLGEGNIGEVIWPLICVSVFLIFCSSF